MSAGRLVDPAVSLGTDPRVDPRIPVALAPFGLDGHAPAPPVSAGSPREAQLAFIAAAETGFEAIFGALTTGIERLPGIGREAVSVPSAHGGPEIPVSIHRPQGASGPLPIVVHIHGGGMTLLTAADPVYTHERD